MIPKGRSAIADVNFAAVYVFVGRALHLPDWRDVRCHVRVSQKVVVSAVSADSMRGGQRTLHHDAGGAPAIQDWSARECAFAKNWE